MNETDRIYHEKQVKELCALHALNNLFQARGSYSKTELDIICNSLSPNVWINPHRSILGLGNYDINVIMAALQKKGCEAVWFDKRKDPGCLDLTNICGFILNVPSEYKFGFVMLPLKRRHWITLRQIHGNFYNLDSKLDSPAFIGRGSDLILYLKEQLQCKDKELFIVVSKEVEETQSWQHHYTSQADACFPKHSKRSPHTTTIQPKDNYDMERRKPEGEQGSETSEGNTNESSNCNNVLQGTT